MQSGTRRYIAPWVLSFVLSVIGLWLWLGWFVPNISAAPVRATWPSSLLLTQIASGFTHPTYIAHAGDGSGRIFVVEQPGRIRIIKSGVVQPTPFLDITSRVNSASSEQGLLSVAFPPGFASKGYFYVDYTNRNGIGDTAVARYRVTANPDVADPSSEEIILTVTQPYANHNGGQLQFGPDGYLYIGMGDGGSGGDPQNNAQTPSALLGKLLRINVEPITTPPSPPPASPLWYFFPFVAKAPGVSGYTIPATNPYTQTAGYRGEIWALGLRNPWRFSFDRSTGDLYIGDVGQDTWEEVDFQPASSAGGENYGWRILEGAHCYNPSSGCVPPAQYVPPVAEYNHGTSDSIGCSITGGYVYRGPGNAAMQDIYFYGDFCTGRIWGLQKDAGSWLTQQLAQPSINISTFGEDEAGNLYVASYYGGSIYQITTP